MAKRRTNIPQKKSSSKTKTFTGAGSKSARPKSPRAKPSREKRTASAATTRTRSRVARAKFLREAVSESKVSVVIATRDRRAQLAHALRHLVALPEKPPLLVFDNGSRDGTSEMVRKRFPEVTLLRQRKNLGCGARTLGVIAADTPYVAFSDDDSWWEPGALAEAARLFDRYPKLGLIAARVEVGPHRRLEPACEQLARSPLVSKENLPGPPVLGFVACGAIVRKEAFSQIAGFNERLEVGGEEELIALDLRAAGWELAYVNHIVAHHHPQPGSERAGRKRRLLRNALWSTWLRWPAGMAIERTAALLAQAIRDRNARRGLLDAALGLPWVLMQRKALPGKVMEELNKFEDRV